MRRTLVSALLLGALVIGSAEAGKPKVDKRLKKDIEFAIKEVGKACSRLIKSKGINWKKSTKSIKAAAKKVTSEAEYTRLLLQLLARLNDGHAALLAPKGKQITWPEDMQIRQYAPGMHWCRIGRKIYVKLVFDAARASGLLPGSQILSVDGDPIDKWLAARVASHRELRSFSTDHHAELSTMHWGLAEPKGTRIKLKVKTPTGKSTSRTISVGTKRNYVDGPVAVPAGSKRTQDLAYGRTPGGFGYIHIRRCKRTVVEQLDTALAGLGHVPGLILDFRGNSGGAFDHEAFFGRFIPEGKRITFNKNYGSAGPAPYGGPVVVIVDGTVVSAGETCSGMLKEDGRAYMIGETPTAGMSSSKTVIKLPSGLAELRVSVASNMGRFNTGKGIEGIGVPPHREVAYDPKDLAAGIDTMIRTAETIFADWPIDDVPYRPGKFDWAPKPAR